MLSATVRADAAGYAAAAGHPLLRTYAHCTPPGAFAESGQTTLVVLNLGDEPLDIELGSDANATLWQLAPSPKPGLGPGTGLSGTGVMLNGQALHLQPDGAVPDLGAFAWRQNSSAIRLAARSVSFAVFRGSGGACSQTLH